MLQQIYTDDLCEPPGGKIKAFKPRRGCNED